jgi:uncharacterized DUF497 family protein
MFTWDIEKVLANFEKHAVSFEEAATVFADENGLDWADPKHSTQEMRSKRLGLSIQERILIVVYTVRSLKNGKETIRIISARVASRKERKAYFD